MRRIREIWDQDLQTAASQWRIDSRIELAAERESEWIDEGEAANAQLSRFALERRGALRCVSRVKTIDQLTNLSASEAARKSRIEVPWNTSNDRGRSGSRNSQRMFHGKSWTRLSRARALAKTLSGGESQEFGGAQLGSTCAVSSTCWMSRQ